MSLDEHLKSVRHLHGRPTDVDVPALERDLAALWREASHDGEAVTRACLWNLIVCAEGDPAVTRAQELLRTVAPACPSRVILVRTSPRCGGPELEVALSAHVRPAPGGGQILCSEQILLETSAAGADHVPALVRGLCVTDVPTALLLVGPLTLGAPALRRLLGGVERVIIDTADHDGAWALADLAEHVASGFEVADLGWLRLAPLRVLTASLFDAPIGAEPLRRARRVSLVGSRTGALTVRLVIGWLADRLSWPTPRRAAPGTWLVPRPGGDLELDLSLRDGDAGRAGLFALVVEGEHGQRYAVQHAGANLVELSGTGLPTRAVPVSERGEPELIVAALGARGHDPLFLAAVRRAAELGGA